MHPCARGANEGVGDEVPHKCKGRLGGASTILWELVFNKRDEQVNLDIDLNALTDIKLYIYYTDFTELD